MSLSDNYIQILGIDTSQPVLDMLQQIISKHTKQFTFNNIDILLNPNEIISLDIDDIYHKIVREERGGYCFEHNKLLFSICKQMGLDVTRVLGRVVYGQNIDVPRTHQTTILRYEGRAYLIDVGFGPYNPDIVVPFIDEHEEPTTTFWVSQKSDQEYALQTIRDEQPFVLYTFDRAKYTDADFEQAHFYRNCHPQSKFVTTLIISRKTNTKTVFVNNLTFTQLEQSNRTDTKIKSEVQFEQLLREHLQLHLKEDEYQRLYTFCVQQDNKVD